MIVECPACGHRVEMVARIIACPNCGQQMSAAPAFQPPLPSRAGGRKKDPSALEDLRAGYVPERPPPYNPESPAHGAPPWLPATLIILGAFLGLFAIGYLVTVKVASYGTPPPPPPAPAPSTPSPMPGPTDEPGGSRLFSFNNTPPAPPAPPPTPAAPASPAPLPPKPVAPPAASASAPATPRSGPYYAVAPMPLDTATTVTDEAINAAIFKGVNFLIGRFENSRLKHDHGADTQPGAHAIAVLALMHASQSISDERLDIHHPFMIGLIEQLKRYEIPEGLATYCRSLRAQALAFHNRQEDRAALAADTRWLVTASVQGAYGYKQPSAGTTQRSAHSWDNSNSQYGVLGTWAAADAGVAIPASYWEQVQQHWELAQSKDGGWAYNTGDTGTLSMTSAGVNMLFVANEMLSALRPDVQIARPPFSPSLQLGLDWLATGDNAIRIGSHYPYYTLYGMERAGLASGFKMFGRHDWFRVLATQVLKDQRETGAWSASMEDVDTAFALLFLSRGRHPLLMNKLHFVGAWANRPRDVARLAKFTTRETERPLNWQVVSLRSDWGDWMDAPVLYLASHEAPIFDEEDYRKLKAYVDAGGLLFTHADGGKDEFNQWAELVAQKLFKQEMTELPANHFVYTALFRPQEKFGLRGVSNGTRTLMIHSPTDVARRWQAKAAAADRPAFELGANLFVYATGMQVPRNRLETLYVGDAPAGSAAQTIPIARLKYAGDWDPEPFAWERERRLFQRETSIALAAKSVEIEKLSNNVAPFAHLTGTAAVKFSAAQVKALRDYVSAGGVLLIDPCGGSKPFADSIRASLISDPSKATALPADHALLAGRGPGMTAIPKAQVRPYVYKAIGNKFTAPRVSNVGKGAILFSDLDLTSGLLGTQTLGIVGYDSTYAHAFVRNAILWTLNGRGAPPAWASTTRPTSVP